jgi:acetoin:2,6-dichlorophenolindophenol oxidoreductase subunit beta
MTEQPDTRTGSHLVAAALAQEMDRDASVIVFGEDVARLGGVFGATRGLAKRFGDGRTFDTPVSETAFVGMAVGAAQSGLRPVVEIMFADFIGVCYDQVLNQMAKNTYMSGGRVQVPAVLRTAVGCIGSAAQHSQVLSAAFAHVPGLKVAYPGSAGDLAGILVAAIRDDDPVVVLEHKWLLKTRVRELPLNDAGPAGAPIQARPLGRLRRLRSGTDITIVGAGYLIQLAIRATAELEEAGISAGVIDLRSLVPLDRAGLLEAAMSAPCLLVVDDDYKSYGMTGEVMAIIAEELAGEAPAMGRHAVDVPVPASAVLEAEVVPSARSIARAAADLIRRWSDA